MNTAKSTLDAEVYAINSSVRTAVMLRERTPEQLHIESMNSALAVWFMTHKNAHYTTFETTHEAANLAAIEYGVKHGNPVDGMSVAQQTKFLSDWCYFVFIDPRTL